ncbi:MAG: hypothetical protein KAI57_02825 [Candidatus Pacebacteria bacterium]|nr:hypothetical protein [Candidatus Paceibacterota bacterium]
MKKELFKRYRFIILVALFLLPAPAFADTCSYTNPVVPCSIDISYDSYFATSTKILFFNNDTCTVDNIGDPVGYEHLYDCGSAHAYLYMPCSDNRASCSIWGSVNGANLSLSDIPVIDSRYLSPEIDSYAKNDLDEIITDGSFINKKLTNSVIIHSDLSELADSHDIYFSLDNYNNTYFFNCGADLSCEIDICTIVACPLTSPLYYYSSYVNIPEVPIESERKSFSIDFFAGVSEDYYTNSFHLLYPSDYAGSRFQPELTVKPDSAFEIIVALSHYEMSVDNGLALTFSRFSDSSLSTVVETFGENEITAINETASRSTIKLKTNVENGITKYYKLSFYSPDDLVNPLASLPFILTGDSTSSNIPVDYDSTNSSYCSDYGTFLNAFCKLIVPSPDFFPNKFNELRLSFDSAFPFIAQIKFSVFNGLAKLRSAGTSAPTIANSNIMGAEVNFYRFDILNGVASAIRNFVSIAIWFGLIVFLIRKSTNLLSPHQ